MSLALFLLVALAACGLLVSFTVLIVLMSTNRMFKPESRGFPVEPLKKPQDQDEPGYN